MENKKNYILICLLVIFLVFSIVITISIGSADISVESVYKILVDKLFNHGIGLNSGLYSVSEYQIVWNIRLPRVIMGLIAGSGLAICGAAMQSLLLNPIADPYILGVSSGASAGAAFALLMPISIFVGGAQVIIFAMLGSIIASALVYSIAKVGSGNRIQPVTLLLAGTAVNAVMSAITSLLIFLAKSNESIAAVYNWQMGSIASAQWKTIPICAVFILAVCLIFVLRYREFNLIMMGEDEANALGLSVNRFRITTAALISLVVASLVSVTGIIGFVGLIVPHMSRFITRTSDNKVIFVFSIIIGGSFVIWADALSRGAFGAAELPIGIITAFIGGPFFLYLMMKKKYAKGEIQ
jgi:iron complex transport system permease protein